jgi:hypothetical protein
MTMTTLPLQITAGVDTHRDAHVVAVLDKRGALLGVESFDTTADGYRRTLGWLRGFGTVELVGVEGTGSYGAGLTRHLLAEGIAVVEVDRPNGNGDASAASPIPKTPLRQLGRRSPVTHWELRRPETETSKPCGYCASRVTRRATHAPKR